MSKKLICLAAAVALLFTSLGATVCAAEQEGYDYVIYDNNFEKAKTGAGLSSEDIGYRPENANYAVIEENGGKYYTFSPSSTDSLANSGNLETGIFNNTAIAEKPVQKLKLEIDLKLSGTFEAYLATYYRGVNAGGINGSRDNLVVFTEEGEYYMQNAPDFKRNYTPNTWMHFTVYVDYIENVFSVYDDQGVLGENVVLKNDHSVQCFNQIRTVIKRGNSSECEVSIDNIVYATTKEEYDKLGFRDSMPPSYTKRIVDADFESGTGVSSGWDKKYAEGLTYTVVSALEEELPQADTHGNVLKIAKEMDNATDNFFRIAYGLVMEQCDMEELKHIQTSFDLYLPEKCNLNLRYLDNVSGSATKGDTLMTFSNDGTIGFLGSTKTLAYSEKCWYSFDLFLDFETKTYSVYMDGKPTVENLPLQNLDTCIISFGFQAAETTKRYAHYWDNIVFAVPDSFGAVKTYPADGAKNVNVLDNAVITMSNPIDGFDSSYLTVTENGLFYNNYEVSCEENIITVTFPQGLAYDSEYEIKVSAGMQDIFEQTLENDFAIAFTSMSPGVAVSVPVFTDENGKILNEWPEDNTLKAAASAKNGSAEEKKIALVTAVYNPDSSMKELYVDEKDMPVGSAESFETYITTGYEEGDTVKAFMCETDGIYQMLREEYAAIPSGNMEFSDSKAEFAFENLSINEDELEIKGKLSVNEVKVVLITVTDDTGDIVMITPLQTNVDGTFSLCFNLQQDSDGVLTVYANGANINNTECKKIAYLTDAKKSEITESINKAENIQSIKTIMEQNKQLLNLDETVFNNNTYRVIYEQLSYDSYEEFIEMAELAENLMTQINEADWSTLTQLFKDYENIILYGADNLSEYNAYSESKQNRMNKELVKKSPFADFEQLRTEFSAVVANYEESNAGSSGGSSRPSGGGSSSSSGGGSVAASYNVTVPENNVPADESQSEEQVFGDLDLTPWAKTSILGLYEKGVISEDDTFRPLDNIKREEFVKMLIEMLGIAKTDEPCGFTDAREGEWYCEYLSSARSAGIINGNTDGSFGVGSNITRQDMAVMAYRAVAAAGKNIMPAADVSPFTDSEDVSDYAKQAVEEMHRAGIISGTGDGAFEPENYANRAQAAVMIYNLMCAQTEAIK